MKTERRHELQHNTLSDVLGHQIEHVRPHSTKLLAAGILGAAVIIVIAMITKDRQSAAAQARNDLYLALAKQDREALQDVAKSHSGTSVAWWAKIAQADIDLNDGLAELYINREEAFQSLDDAKKAYTEIVNGAGNNPDLVRHALFGLASAHEATSNLDKAKEYYQRVVQQYADSTMATESRARLEALKDPQTEKWYSWFSRQKPKPRATGPGVPGFPGMPPGAMPHGEMPTGLGSLPDSPDFGPGLTPPSGTPGATGEASTSAPSTSVPSTTEPATTEAKPDSTPSESKREAKPDAAATPATPEAKPADAKPAESKPDSTGTNPAAEAKPAASESTPSAKASSESPSP